MNNRQNGRRRGRGGQQPRNGQASPHSGNRIDNRQRGNAAQLLEKYKTLARDAQMAGDRVNTEYYLQFADHYFRVLSENRSRFEEQQQQRRPRDEFGQEYGMEDEGDPNGRTFSQRDNDDQWDDEDESESQPQQGRMQQAQMPQQGQPSRREQPQRNDRRPAQASAGGYRDAPRSVDAAQAAPTAVPDRRAPTSEHGEAEAPGRIEIALPPALSVDRAPAIEPNQGAEPIVAEDAAPAPKRRRTRKPKDLGETLPIDL